MSVFDPYHKWLGIPPAEQPPNHYRLLGVALYEPDADVIESAADRQMAHVQTHKHGPNAEESQKLLNELSAARVCLLDSRKKAAYDAELRARLSPKRAARAVQIPVQHAAPPPAAPPTSPPPLAPSPKPLPAMRGHAFEDAAAPAAVLQEEVGIQVHEPGVHVRPAGGSSERFTPRRKKSQTPLIVGSIVGGLAIVALIIVLASGGGDDDTAQKDKQPAGEASGKTSKTTPVRGTSPAGGGRELPKDPALWNPEGDDPNGTDPSSSEPDSTDPSSDPDTTGNPPKNPSGGKKPPKRLPDPVVLGPDGQPKNPTSSEDDDPSEDDPQEEGPPAEAAPAQRFPLPSAQELTAARREMREDYADDFKSLTSDQARYNLAEKLFKAAAAAPKGSAQRFVMAETACDLSKTVGVPAAAASAMIDLAKEYEIADPVKAVADAFYEASRNAKTPDGRDAAVAYVPKLLAGAIQEDHFVAARRIVQAGKVVAASSPAAKRGPLNDEFDLLARGVTMLENRHRDFAEATTTLEESPDDATAHQAAGIYRGLFANDWTTGAPHLAKSSEDELKKLGEKEVVALPGGAALSTKDMTALADGWLAHAGRQNSPHKEVALLRARHWFDNALSKLKTSEKSRAKKLIGEIDAQLKPLEFAAFFQKLRTEQELISTKSAVIDVAGVWEHRPAGQRPQEITLNPDGTIKSAANPVSGITWTFDGTMLIMRWPSRSAPGGAWIDTCTVSEDGQTYSGTNQIGRSVNGRRKGDVP
jgi:hypothetical protein